MNEVINFFRLLISNFQEELNVQSKVRDTVLIPSLKQIEIDKFIFAINDFWLMYVKKEDSKIYATQIVRESTALYDSLFSKLLTYDPTCYAKLQISKKSQDVILKLSEEKKIDITNVIKDVKYFTQKLSMYFDCGNIDLNKIYEDLTIQNYLKFKNTLDFTPYDRQLIH